LPGNFFTAHSLPHGRDSFFGGHNQPTQRDLGAASWSSDQAASRVEPCCLSPEPQKRTLEQEQRQQEDDAKEEHECAQCPIELVPHVVERDVTQIEQGIVREFESSRRLTDALLSQVFSNPAISLELTQQEEAEEPEVVRRAVVSSGLPKDISSQTDEDRMAQSVASTSLAPSPTGPRPLPKSSPRQSPRDSSRTSPQPSPKVSARASPQSSPRQTVRSCTASPGSTCRFQFSQPPAQSATSRPRSPTGNRYPGYPWSHSAALTSSRSDCGSDSAAGAVLRDTPEDDFHRPRKIPLGKNLPSEHWMPAPTTVTRGALRNLPERRPLQLPSRAHLKSECARYPTDREPVFFRPKRRLYPTLKNTPGEPRLGNIVNHMHTPARVLKRAPDGFST